MEKHVLSDLGDEFLTGVDVRTLRGLRGSLEAKGLATGTVWSILSIFRTLMTYAVAVGELLRSPFTGSKIMPDQDDPLPRCLDDETVDKILLACPTEHVLTVRLAVATGLRWGELMRLTWSRVVWNPRPQLVLEGTKGRRKKPRNRTVPLDPEITGVLKEARARTSGLMVIDNQPSSSRVIRRQIEKKTGIHFRFHDLRHTFAVRYVQGGGSLAMLRKILGHGSLKMVIRYADPAEEAIADDAERAWRNRTGNTTGSKGGSTEEKTGDDKAVTR